jgi:ATP-binding cassette, subfamily B, bacterial
VAPGSIRRIFRHFGPHLRSHRAKLAAATLFMIGATAMELLRPWPLKLIFDGILMPTPSAGELLAYVPALASHPERLLLAIALSVLAIATAGGLFRYGQAYLTASAGQKVIAAIRVQLYSHIQRLSQSFHDTKSSGDLMTRLTRTSAPIET